MFEEEAEENLVEQLGFDKDFIEQELNKLKNPNEKFMVDSMIREVKYAFQKGAIFGYKKANEWHYVKDGLPEELHDVLCFVIHNEHRYFLQGHLRDGKWVLSPLGTYLNNEDVIAWKEIDFPKED